AAAKAARGEMMQRIRENKDKNGGASRSGGGGGGRSNGNGARNGSGNGQRNEGQQARNGNGNGGGQQPRGGQRPQPAHRQANNGQGARPPQQQQARDVRPERDEDGEDRMPRNVDPLRTNMPGRRDMTGVKRISPNGQPDPTRTSIDSMGAGARRGGGGNRRGGNPARNYGR
ncbi:MAG TPA: RNA helicase, partial [Ramlibacter sp.]|nr:RNA helicase [Ramlibacter sp.]